MAGEFGVPLTWGSQIDHATAILAAKNFATPRRDAIALLSYLLGRSVAEIESRPLARMRLATARRYSNWVKRRADGEPLPYITGHLEFMGLDVAVGPHAPLPAVGAEQLVETVLQWARGRTPGELVAAELCTGCGAIALALAALEPRFTRVYALDTLPERLVAASANGARYLLNLVVNWLAGETLDALPEPADLVVYGALESDSPLRGAQMLAQSLERLRPGGAFICLLDESGIQGNVGALATLFPSAQVWVDSRRDGVGIVVAQWPRPGTEDE